MCTAKRQHALGTVHKPVLLNEIIKIFDVGGYYMFGDSYGTRHQQPWRDTMQVCLKGHVINEGFRENPQRNKDFCDRCGEKTITNCPNCDKSIPGDLQDTGVVTIGFLPSAPEFCEHCGEKFPWTHKAEAKRLKEGAEKPIEALQRVFSKFHPFEF